MRRITSLLECCRQSTVDVDSRLAISIRSGRGEDDAAAATTARASKGVDDGAAQCSDHQVGIARRRHRAAVTLDINGEILPVGSTRTS
jgi:hypothetical protein